MKRHGPFTHVATLDRRATMMMLSGTIVAAILNGLPASHTGADEGDPRNGVVFVAPMGIFIPLNHNGLAFMNDAPSVAIDMFEPDAEVTLNEFALLSQSVELLDLEIGRDGKVRAVTLNLPDFPRIDGEIPVKSLLIKSDGTVEFSPLAADSQ
jgi:hypothetical protein